MSAALIAGRVVDAVAGHGHHIALFLERLGQQYLVLGCDPAHHADVVDPLQAFWFGQGGEISAQDRLARYVELLGDSGSGDDVVAGHHPHPDVSLVCARHCGLRLLPRGVDHADEAGHLQVVRPGRAGPPFGSKPAGVEVADRAGHHPQTGLAHALDVLLGPLA